MLGQFLICFEVFPSLCFKENIKYITLSLSNKAKKFFMQIHLGHFPIKSAKDNFEIIIVHFTWLGMHTG